MKKILLSITAFTVLFLAGCTTGAPEPDPVLLKLDELDARLDRVESVLNNQSLLDLQNDNDNLTGQIRELRNQVETLSFTQDGSVERQKNQYIDLDNRLQAMETRSVRQVYVPSSVPAGGTLVPDGVSATPAIAASGSERDVYQSAFDLLKGGKYTDAAAGFETYLQQYPDGQLADNAHYWLGESYYITRKFDDALRSFATVTARYPQSRKIADAWLKLGYTYYEMKKITEAQAALEKTATSFPDSSAALLAKQRLDRITKEQG
jgi:tol-pal system protein YbgF